MGIIYCATNKVNGKKYIGQTRNNLEVRKSNHMSDFKVFKRTKPNSKFYRAMDKYGWDSFEWSVLEEGISVEDLNEREIEYIREFKTYNSEYGYNMTLGGTYISKKDTIETRTEEEVESIIKKLVETDLNSKEIADELGEKHWYVRLISRRNTHKHIWDKFSESEEEYRKRRGKKIRRTPIKTIEDIIKDVEKDEQTLKDIALKYDVKINTVWRIANGVSYAYLWDYESYSKVRNKDNKIRRGDDNPRNKYRTEVWENVKKDIIETDMKLKDIAKKHGMTEESVYSFNRGFTRKDVWGEDENPRVNQYENSYKYHTKDKFEEVYKKYYLEGEYAKDIKVEGISVYVIRHFVSNKVKGKREWFEEFKDKYGFGVRSDKQN